MSRSMLHAVRALCAWLERTPFSHELQTREWAMPAVQTVHLLAIATVMASALFLNLRLLRVRMADVPLSRVLARFVPVILGSVVILLLSGVVMIFAEPERALLNPVFALKMALLAGVLVLTAATIAPVRRIPAFWESGKARPRLLRAMALLSTGLWVAVLCAGRWIAYARS
jgi:hypothetical protein